MFIKKKQFFVRSFILLVVISVLTVSCFAGSAGKPYSIPFTGTGESSSTCRAYKSNAGTTSGNHATVGVTSMYNVGNASFRVCTTNGVPVTYWTPVAQGSQKDLTYILSVTNGYLDLHAKTSSIAAGGAAVTGTWWP